MKLERKLSLVNTWSLALGCIIGWGAFVMPGNTFLPKAGPLGAAIAIGIAGIVMIIIAFNYDFMIRQYPVSGGEFIYARNNFGEVHGFICSWFLGLSYLAIVPLNATALALVGKNLLNNIFQVGFLYNVCGYDIYVGEIVIAIFALMLFAWLNVRGVKFIGSFQTCLTFVLVGGVLILAIVAILSSEVSLNNVTPVFYPENSKISSILSVVAVAPWAFVGFDTIPQAAEEFNFSPKKAKRLMILSIVFGAIVYIILNTISAIVIPSEYSDWVEYVDDISNLNGLKTLPTFYAARKLLGRLGVLIIGFSVLAAILSGIAGFYMATSRLLYSMSKENVLPKWFGQLHDKYKTPKNSIIFIMIISLVAPFFGRVVLEWIVNMSSLGAAIGYTYTSASALKSAYKIRDRKILVTGLLGTILSTIFIILLLVPIPMLNCSLGKESYICLGIWVVFGILFYIISKCLKV